MQHGASLTVSDLSPFSSPLFKVAYLNNLKLTPAPSKKKKKIVKWQPKSAKTSQDQRERASLEEAQEVRVSLLGTMEYHLF